MARSGYPALAEPCGCSSGCRGKTERGFSQELCVHLLAVQADEEPPSVTCPAESELMRRKTKASVSEDIVVTARRGGHRGGWQHHCLPAGPKLRD